MADSEDTYPMPEHGWTCFHCGVTFLDPSSASIHFGADPSKEPGCMLRVQDGAEKRMLRALRKAETEIERLRAANEQLDYEAGEAEVMRADLKRYFKGASTVRSAWLRYEAMEGRALAAEETLNGK